MTLSVPALEHHPVEFDMPTILHAFAVLPRMSEALGLRLSEIARIEFQPHRDAISVINAEGTPVAELRAASLFVLLVAYCERIKVPLPRLDQKSVKVTSRSVLLRVPTAARSDQPQKHIGDTSGWKEGPDRQGSGIGRLFVAVLARLHLHR